MRYTKNAARSLRVLALASSALFGLAGPSMAQTTTIDSAADDTAEDAEIVVVGSIVSAQASAIEEKREADNLVDVISADSVGRFPDQNAAAALSRLPAVAVQRDQGQERYVQVRGAPNRWVSVSLDGVPLIGVDEGGTTRAFRFDSVPAVLLSSAALNKSLTADLSAEAVVANVDLRTFSPLTRPGFSLVGDLGLGEMELGGGEQQQGSVRASWANDRFGFVLGGSHYRRDQVTDNREVGAYDALGPTELDIRNYQLIRENNGLFAGVEFQASPQLLLSANTIYTEFKDDEDRDQYEFRLTNAVSGTRSLTGGDMVGVPLRGTFNRGEYRTNYTITTFAAEFDNDVWAIDARLNFTTSENTTFLPLVQFNTTSATAPSIGFTFGNTPIVQLFTTLPAGGGLPARRGNPLTAIDQTTAFNGGVTYISARQDSFSDSWTAMVDVDRTLGDWTLSGGLSYIERSLDGFVFATSNVALLTGRINPANYVINETWATGFPLGFQFRLIDNGRLRNDLLAAAPGAPTPVPGQTFSPANDVPAQNRYDLTERTLAGYAQAEWDFGEGQVVFGVRAERFGFDNTGTVSLGGGRFQTLTVSDEDWEFFPSVNARLDLGENWVVRVAAQRSLARPSFGEVRIGASINDTASPGTISGGNPALTPETTWGLDASVEYYPSSNAIVAASVFTRFVDNVLYTNTELVGSDVFDSGGVDRSAYRLTSTFNGNEGQLTGIEFSYQQQFTFLPAPFDGLGFQGNYTLLDGSFDTATRKDIPFPGTSDSIVNASIYYERGGFSGRVSYQWRDRWLDTLGGLGVGAGTGDEYRKEYENLDIALRYALNDNFTLFADFANLTDAEYIVYQGTEQLPTEVEQIGRRTMFGLRFNF
jgi:TonB-dependent receptor